MGWDCNLGKDRAPLCHSEENLFCYRLLFHVPFQSPGNHSSPLRTGLSFTAYKLASFSCPSQIIIWWLCSPQQCFLQQCVPPFFSQLSREMSSRQFSQLLPSQYQHSQIYFHVPLPPPSCAISNTELPQYLPSLRIKHSDFQYATREELVILFPQIPGTSFLSHRRGLLHSFCLLTEDHSSIDACKDAPSTLSQS